MTQSTASAVLNLGFLTVLQEAPGYVGGYLVTNQWGRPLEFRLSSAVQPTRVQQILYASTLLPYLCGELIARTLLDKTGLAVQLIITDREPVLELRRHQEAPVIWLATPDDPLAATLADAGAVVGSNGHRGLYCHPHFLADIPLVQQFLDRLGSGLDLTEPFARIREAIGEARKMGMTNRMTG